MARIFEQQLYQLVSNNTGKKAGVVELIVSTLWQQICKEIQRGNEVCVMGFGIFEPEVIQGLDRTRMKVKFRMSDTGIEYLNNGATKSLDKINLGKLEKSIKNSSSNQNIDKLKQIFHDVVEKGTKI